jgi:hypothetical protein
MHPLTLCEHVPASRTDGRFSPRHPSNRLKSSAPSGGMNELLMFSLQGVFTISINNTMTSLEDGSHVPYAWEQETRYILTAGFTFDHI